MRISLNRFKTSDQGTLGILVSSVFNCCTIELPWRDNHRNISCIPTGVYDCVWYYSNKYGRVLNILDVPFRFGILIHYGNWAGNKDLGYLSDSDGCIIVGSEHSKIRNQDSVIDSKYTLNKFIKALGMYTNFKIKIDDWVI